MKRIALFLAVVACGSHAPTPQHVATLPSARPAAHHAPAHAAWPLAHWVPRIAPSTLSPGQLRRSRSYAPMQNNYGTMRTVYLGGGRAGMLVSGGRAIWEGGKLGEIRDASMDLSCVLPVTPALGGGFVIVGKDGTYFAQTFDGALVKLSGAPQAFDGRVGPHVIQTGTWLVSTSTGQPMNGAPENVRDLYAHRRLGFAIAIDYKDAIWHSRDGRAWKKLATLGNVRDGVEDGDALVLVGHENEATRVSADGKLTTVKLTDDERMTLSLANLVRPPLAEPFEGALIDDGWAPSGRSADEWFVVRGRDVLVAHAPQVVTKKIATTPEEGCSAITLERPLLACVTLGQRLHVFHIDLATGATELEKSIDVSKGLASRIGTAPGSYPSTLIVTAQCSGANPNDGLCVRDDQGGWREWPGTIPHRSQILPFPEGTIVLSDNAGAIELRVMGRVVRTIASSDYAKMDNELQESSMAGTLATERGVDMFFEPNPLKPIALAVSWVMHLPLDPAVPPTLTRTSGVVAAAGRHALRLDRGKLYATSDGWTTWSEVPPPPSGAPDDLADAMCMDSGCLIGPWARVGW